MKSFHIVVLLFLTNFLLPLCYGTDWCSEAARGTIFGTSQSDSYVIDCAIVWPRLLEKSGKVSQLSIENVFGRSMQIRLMPSRSLLSKDFIFLVREKQRNEIIPQNSADEKSCSYQIMETNISGSVNVCQGFQGIWTVNGTTMVIQPFNNNATSLQLPHKIIKYELKNNQNSFRQKLNLFQNSNSLISKIRERQGKNFRFFPEDSIGHLNAMKNFLTSVFSLSTTNQHRRVGHSNMIEVQNVTIELAIFVDQHLYRSLKETFPEETEKNVINVVDAMMNAVQILYDDDSLEHRVNLAIKRLEVMGEDLKEYEESKNVQELLRDFCKWQSDENHLQDRSLHWDHALLLTGLDLESKTTDGKVSNKIVGLAPVSGMCDPKTSCTVSEGNHFESVFVIAHEFGHNLGMKHDGRTDLNECDPSGYLMSPTLGSGKNTWSICSQRYLDKFLRSPQSSCLKTPLAPKQSRDHMRLPGEMFPADVQCQLQFGPKSRHSILQEEQDICTDLHCTKDHFTWTSHSALEGTACGFRKWCRRGICIKKEEKVIKEGKLETHERLQSSSLSVSTKKIDGHWSSWSAYGSCSCQSGSSIRGLQKSIRTCSDPKPQNGGNPCNRGRHDDAAPTKKFQTCSSESANCLKDVSGHVESICRDANLIDSDILPFGDAQNTSSCQVQCFKAGSKGGSISKGWKFPDGTKCGLEDQFCVDGECKKFSCDDSAIFKINHRKCRKRKQRHSKWTNWKTLTGCSNSCIESGAGFRLVTRECLAPHDCAEGLHHSVQICHERLASSFHCNQRISTNQYASILCSRYKSPKLSGIGRQLDQLDNSNDPDRACKVSCQDSTLPQRYYVVSSKDGFLPPGTPCAKNSKFKKKSFCVMGKCLEFGNDMTPKQVLSNETLSDIREMVINKPKSLRLKRELFIEPPKLVSVNHSVIHEITDQEMEDDETQFHHQVGSIEFKPDIIGEIAFDDPIDIADDELITTTTTYQAQAFVSFNQDQSIHNFSVYAFLLKSIFLMTITYWI